MQALYHETGCALEKSRSLPWLPLIISDTRAHIRRLRTQTHRVRLLFLISLLCITDPEPTKSQGGGWGRFLFSAVWSPLPKIIASAPTQLTPNGTDCNSRVVSRREVQKNIIKKAIATISNSSINVQSPEGLVGLCRFMDLTVDTVCC